jgi:hypothetical protein
VFLAELSCALPDSGGFFFQIAELFVVGISRTAQRCCSITSSIGEMLSFATGFGTPLARASR